MVLATSYKTIYMFNLNKEYNTSYQKKKRILLHYYLERLRDQNYTRISQSPKATGKVSNPLYENSGNFETGLKSPPYSSLSLSIWNSKRPQSQSAYLVTGAWFD